MLSTTSQSKSGSHQSNVFKLVIAPLVPYVTVGIGLLVIHNAWAAILSYHLAMLVIIITSKRGLSFLAIFKGGDKLRMPLLVTAGVCGGIILWLLKTWILVPGEAEAFTQSIGLTKQSWPFFMVYFVLVSPVLEELYWRSYLGNPTNKPVLNDFLFAGYHILVLVGITQIVWLGFIFFVLAAIAWIWRQSNRLGGGLMPSIVSHFTADCSIIIASYLLLIRI